MALRRRVSGDMQGGAVKRGSKRSLGEFAQELGEKLKLGETLGALTFV